MVGHSNIEQLWRAIESLELEIEALQVRVNAIEPKTPEPWYVYPLGPWSKK